MPLPDLNAEGRPAQYLTDEQRYLLDLKGWIAIPGVLTDDEVTEMRDFCYRLHRDRAAVPIEQRSSVGGPLQRLADHPLIVGFMNEFVGHGPLATEEGYGFRLESTFLTIRGKGHDNFRPHGGGGMFNFPGNSHVYCCRPGAINTGLTRAVWELNPVEEGDGGTVFLSGSHKAAFRPPTTLIDRDSPFWETYSCPAGSLLFFTEAITHSGSVWTNAERDRVAIFNCYNTINSKWHEWVPHPELLADMPARRQTLFRPVHAQNNRVGGEPRG